MSTIPIIATAILSVYLIYTAIKAKEIPDSISDTAYVVKYTNTFTIFILLLAALFVPSILEKSAENTQFLAALTGAGLLGVAATPNYKTEGKLAHYGGGILSGVASQLLIYLNNPTPLYSWVLFPILALLSKENSVFWAEIICIYNMLLYII